MSETNSEFSATFELPSSLEDFVILAELFANLNEKSVISTANQIIKKYDSPKTVDLVASTLSFFFHIRLAKQNIYLKLGVELCKRFKNMLWASLFMMTSGMLLYSLYKYDAIPLDNIRQRCTVDKEMYYFFAKELGIPHFYSRFQLLFDVTPITNNESRDDSEENIVELVRDELTEMDWMLYEELRTTGYMLSSVQGIIMRDSVEDFIKISNIKGFNTESVFDESPFIGNGKKYTYISFAARYGARNCFSYLSKRKCVIDDDVILSAIMGGNIEIIDQCFSMGAPINNVMAAAIRSHDNKVIDFVKSKISSAYSPLDCIIGFNLSEIAGSTLDFEPQCINYAVMTGYSLLVKFVISKGNMVNYHDEELEPPLIIATRNCFYDVVELLIKEKANVNISGKRGETALHVSCLNGILEMGNLLLNYGASPKIRTSYNETPLNAVAFSGLPVLACNLIDFGGDLDQTNPPIATAIIDGRLQMLEFFLSKGANPNIVCNARKEYPLHLAIKKEDYRYCRALVNHDADVNAEDINGETPIVHAFIRGDPAITKMLSRKGTKLKRVFRSGCTLLHYAAQADKLDGLKYLLQIGLQINQVDHDGRSPLFCAVEAQRYDVMEFLVSQGANVNIKGRNGDSSLHIAARDGSLEAVDYLLQQGSDVDDINNDSKTSLDIASELGNMEIVECLLRYEALFTTKFSITTPVHLAAQGDHVELVKFFLDFGLEVDFKNDGNETILHVASKNGSMKTAEYLISVGADTNAEDNNGDSPLSLALYNDKIEIAKLLLDNYSDPNTKNSFAEPILFWCIKNNKTDEFALLIQYEVDFDISNADDQSVLHICAINDAPSWVRILTTHEIDKDSLDKNSETPLHIAVKRKHLEVAEALLETGANPNIKNDSGQTPLHLAVLDKNISIMRALVNNGADPCQKDNSNLAPIDLIPFEMELEFVDMCLPNGYNINRTVDGEHTHLLMSVFYNRLDYVAFYVKNKANIDCTDIEGRTPLFHAIMLKHSVIICHLIENGADPFFKANDGRTPFVMGINCDDHVIRKLVDPKFTPPASIAKEVNNAIERIKKISRSGVDMDDEEEDENDENGNNDMKNESNDRTEGDTSFTIKRKGKKSRNYKHISLKKEKEEEKELKRMKKKMMKKMLKKQQKLEQKMKELAEQEAKKKQKSIDFDDEEDEEEKEEISIPIEPQRQPPKTQKVFLEESDVRPYGIINSSYATGTYFLKLALFLAALAAVIYFLGK